MITDTLQALFDDAVRDHCFVWPGSGPVYITLEPITRDDCEVCGLRLYPSERVEITEEAQPVSEDGMVGFGSMTAVYCHTHAPEES